jgi:uncharacterized protein (DUF983 family)
VTDSAPPPSHPHPRDVALKGLCPRCGAPSLFDGWVKFADRCPSCGLDIAGFNVGDGPAALLILVIGALVVGLAIWLQLALDPPFWLQALIWIPGTIALVIVALRIAKGALIGLEFRNAAREGRLKDRP